MPHQVNAFNTPGQVNKKDPKSRVNPYFDLLQQRSQRLLTPGKDIAVDEALMLWKGRLGFNQFIRTKGQN